MAPKPANSLTTAPTRKSQYSVDSSAKRATVTEGSYIVRGARKGDEVEYVIVRSATQDAALPAFAIGCMISGEVVTVDEVVDLWSDAARKRAHKLLSETVAPA